MNSRYQFRVAGRWIAGIGVSLLAAWGITAVFTENYYPRAWVPELERNVPTQGWTFDHRSEGWARSRFGKFGLIGAPDHLSPHEPKYLIWGDSFVKAFQVPDRQKMHVVLSRQLKEGADQEGVAIGVGRIFQSVADYVFQIPIYEEALGNVRLHIIHLFTLQDIIPDVRAEDRISLFLTEPELRFERYDNEYREIEKPEPPDPIRDLAYRARLQFFLKLKNRLARTARGEGLRFSLGRQESPHGPEPPAGWGEFLDPEWTRYPPPLEAWNFALEELDSLTEVPILIVYAPPVPALERGQVRTANPEESHVIAFESRCDARGIGFVNLGEAFANYHEDTGRFVTGFPASRPWEGHYNEAGHRLVAEAIRIWIEENQHDLHPD